jgi:hypothetical protein
MTTSNTRLSWAGCRLACEGRFQSSRGGADEVQSGEASTSLDGHAISLPQQISSEPLISPKGVKHFTGLIGIDPDGRVHVSDRLLMLDDGPLLEQRLKAAAGALIRLPSGKHYHPDRERLAARFGPFQRAA